MKFFLIRFAVILLGYAFGMIESGLIYSKITGIDLKHKGSGNTGATNTLRVAGKKAGAIVLAADIIKCIIPMIIAGLIFSDMGGDTKIMRLYAGFGAILGHNFPFYLHFKGGKGVACSGAIVIVMDPIIALIGILFFSSIVYLTGYVSLASMLAITLAYIGFLIHAFVIGWGLSLSGMAEIVILGLLMVMLSVIQHRANIERLIQGCENKIFDRKKKKEQE